MANNTESRILAHIELLKTNEEYAEFDKRSAEIDQAMATLKLERKNIYLKMSEMIQQKINAGK